MRFDGSLAIVAAASLLLAISLVGQSKTPVAPTGTFHVQGTVQGFRFSRTVGAEVIFQSTETRTTLRTDGQGSYEADLPWGVYTMTTNYNGQPVYQRPAFRVMSSETIVLNVTVYQVPPCEVVVPVQKDSLPREESDRACNGIDRVVIPSKDGIAFELLIHFPYKRTTKKEYLYWGPHGRVPVFAAYDLFTLKANQITYNKDTQELKAIGNVVSTNEPGNEIRAENATFKIEEGRVTQIR